MQRGSHRRTVEITCHESRDAVRTSVDSSSVILRRFLWELGGPNKVYLASDDVLKVHVCVDLRLQVGVDAALVTQGIVCAARL